MKAARRIGILGLGNILMGDDGVGPTVVCLLLAGFQFPEEVTLQELGTPGLGLTAFLGEYDALILVDAASAGGVAGEVRTYRGEELRRTSCGPRVSPHDPAIAEALFLADLSGRGPQEVVLVGIVPGRVALGCGLSVAARRGTEAAVGEILREMQRLEVAVRRRECAKAAEAWWEKGGRGYRPANSF